MTIRPGALKLIHSIMPWFYWRFVPAGYKVGIVPFESVELNWRMPAAISLEEAICLADLAVVMPPGPGRIVAEERITLERPRDVSSPDFNDSRRRLAALLHADHAREAA